MIAVRYARALPVGSRADGSVSDLTMHVSCFSYLASCCDNSLIIRRQHHRHRGVTVPFHHSGLALRAIRLDLLVLVNPKGADWLWCMALFARHLDYAQCKQSELEPSEPSSIYGSCRFLTVTVDYVFVNLKFSVFSVFIVDSRTTSPPTRAVSIRQLSTTEL